ncbi:hypothetical protein LTR66_011878 [Elasticomyces elasticus]|nr:hypothetical protein LTR66_011878 [Elasticomyces elasticus]
MLKALFSMPPLPLSLLRSSSGISRVSLQQVRRAATSTSIPSPTPSFFARRRRAIAISALSLGLGALGGTLVVHTVAPPALPVPGTHEDGLLMRDLDTQIDSLFQVQILRGKCTAAAAKLRGGEGKWVELDPSSRSRRLVDDSMAGARGLGVERLFWNTAEKRLVAIVWFGGALAGWPGVTHGGALVTVFEEKLSVAAELAAVDKIDEQRAQVHLEEISLDYKKPTYANSFYVIRAELSAEQTTTGQHQIEGRLETMDGKSDSVPGMMTNWHVSKTRKSYGFYVAVGD